MNKRGGYYCPNCYKYNECDCESCKLLPLEGKEVITNGDNMICGFCSTVFSFEEAMDTDFEINIANNKIDRLLVTFKDYLKEKICMEGYKIYLDDTIVAIEAECKNEASKQSYLNKLQEIIYYGHRLELMIYFRSIID